MTEVDLLIIYKSFRLPLLMVAMGFITWYTYCSKKRRVIIEEAKFRMLDED